MEESIRSWIRILGAAAAVVLTVGLLATAGEPIFVNWLVDGDPGDEAIREYWERAQRGELEPIALVDLGTMLFERGFTKDALGAYRQALDADPDLYEAWFRIGLVEHSRGELRRAREAYRRCLKKRPGHGWCNFYLGLVEEELGHSGKALRFYERAFNAAPELANPKVNPEVLASRLALGAQLNAVDTSSFELNVPMRFLQPNRVQKAREEAAGRTGAAAVTSEPSPDASLQPSAEPTAKTTAEAAPPPTAVPTPRPVAPAPRRVPTRSPATPPPDGGRDTGAPRMEAPYGAPEVPQTSDEARLLPRTDGLYRLAEAVI